jgi:tight adherence protein B
VTVLALLAAAAALLWPAGRRRGPADLLVPREGSPGPEPGSSANGTARHGLRRRRARADDALEGLAELVEVLAPPLRAGVEPAAAVAIAAEAVGRRPGLSPLVDALSSAARRGDPLGGAWQRQAHDSGSAELAFLARAWLLSEEAGVPLATMLTTVSRVLRARQAAARALASSTAAARASMTVLTLLPAAGPAVGLLFGFSPLALYTATPAAGASLLTGGLLTAGGWAWSRSILRRALEPEVVA